MRELPVRPLDCLPQQPLKGPSGERLVLRNGFTQYTYPTTEDRGDYLTTSLYINIAKKNAAEFLRDNSIDSYYESLGFLGYDGSWEWSAVVLMPEEYKLCVGGMSVTELRQQLDNYWGQECLLSVVIGYQGMWESIGAIDCRLPKDNLRRDNFREYQEQFPEQYTAVLSRWMNRECTQWLSYFIANNHTLGAVHAWFAAFLGVTRESLPNLGGCFRKLWHQHQYRDIVAFMESIHRIKIRMSFDVCIAGHDQVVDGLPSLPSNSMVTANKQGIQVIHDSINNMFPRRIWDICANTVIPATWFCGPPCPLTGRQKVDNLRVKPVSHAWVADKDRSPIFTEANQHMWPIPLPKGVHLEDVRGEMIRLGVRYAWLDVLCLRQRAQSTLATDLAIPVSMEVVENIPVSTEEVMNNTPVSTRVIEGGTEVVEGAPLSTEVMESNTLSVEEVRERREQRRLEEWKVDVPTIGAIYSNLDGDGLYGGGPIIIFMSGLGRPFRDEGWDSERHWLRRAWTLQESPALHKCLIAGLPGGHIYKGPGSEYRWPWACKVWNISFQLYDIIHTRLFSFIASQKPAMHSSAPVSLPFPYCLQVTSLSRSITARSTYIELGLGHTNVYNRWIMITLSTPP